ncbi:PAS domain S-box protein [Algoriphagus hitonicola]|uniref:histidine kinase n=1 Tax=Algoriphagus hitonicola TaxID=435880 RepID=A0A1I2TNQ1_9BACT|nr:PAS domain S-box protein [Algoriphagus hitonicola]SFG66575.1 PAS domain S-box-containing protein [Algoriphagus hitonicola]
MSQLQHFDISDFLNEIKEPLFLMDSEEIIFWNSYAKEQFEGLPDSWKTWFENEDFIQLINEFFQSGVVPNRNFYKTLSHQNGEKIRFEWSFTNLPSSYTSRFLIVKGSRVKYYGSSPFRHHLTRESNQEKEELNYIQSILNNSHDLIAILDEQGNYKFISESVGQKLGFPVESILGKNFRDLEKEGIIELVKGSFAEVLNSEPDQEVPIDFWIKRSNGLQVYLESYGKNLLDHPEIRGILFSSRDITDFVETGKSLQKRYEIENLINQVSSRLINGQLTEIERDFQDALKLFGDFLKATQAFVLIFNRDTDLLEILNSWSQSDQKNTLKDFIPELVNSRKNRLEAGIVKLIEPETDRDKFYHLFIPMNSASRMHGVIYFEIETSNLQFAEKELQIFRQLGDILAGAYLGRLMTRRLERNENLLTTTERLSKSGSWRFNTSKNLFYVSGGLARLFELGDRPLTAEYSSLIYKIEKPDRARFVKHLKQVIKTKGQVSGEFMIRTADQKIKFLSYEIEVKEDFFRSGLEVNGFCTDISHKRAADEHLRLQSQILAQVDDPIMVTDLNLKVIYLNEAASQFFKTKSSNPINKSIDDILNIQWGKTSSLSVIAERLEVGDSWREEVVLTTDRVDGLPYELSIQGIHAEAKEKIGYSFLFRSLVERYQSQEIAMRARKIVENSPAILFRVDPNDEYRIHYISENINRFGYSSKELMDQGIQFMELVHPEDVIKINAQKEKLRGQSGVPSFSGQYRIKHKAGHFVWVEDKTTDVRNKSGEIIMHEGLFQDISERKSFEVFKAEKEKQYRVLASNIPGTNIFLLDANRRYILAEGTNFDYWELKPEDFEGRHLSEIVLTDPKQIEELLDRVYFDQEIVESEFKLKDRWYYRLMRPIMEDGKVAYALTIIRDITSEYEAKANLKRSEEKYRTLVEESTEIIFSLSETFILDYVSPNVSQFLGYETAEVLGKSIFEYLNPEDLDLFQSMLSESRDFLAENQFLEFRLRHKDGTYRIFNSNGKMILDKSSDTRYYTGIARDISKLKEAQRELLLAKEMAEMASQAKSQFLSIMSHEIRTPMNAVIGLAHFLMEEDPRPDQLENLKTLQFSAENLMALINDILDFNKIESGKVELESIPFDLKNLIQRIIHSHSFQAHEKPIEILTEFDEAIPELVIGDSIRIGQVVNNLVSNAIKFTERGQVKVCLKVANKESEKIRILFRFEDTGIGIPEDKVGGIFEAFTQASSSTTRKFGGTGLGLAIVKRLINLHGGEIDYQSNPQGGSIFEFEIEFSFPNETIKRTAQEKESLPKSLQQASILVAEDNTVNQILIRKFLKKWNAGNLVFAADGQEAMEMFEKGDFDLILVDLQMPIMDGFTAARKMRNHADPKKSRLPILALTASSFHEVKDALEEIGFDDYIPKPFSPEVLYEKLIKHLRSKN